MHGALFVSLHGRLTECKCFDSATAEQRVAVFYPAYNARQLPLRF
jgi:hypothetical protein